MHINSFAGYINNCLPWIIWTKESHWMRMNRWYRWGRMKWITKKILLKYWKVFTVIFQNHWKSSEIHLEKEYILLVSFWYLQFIFSNCHSKRIGQVLKTDIQCWIAPWIMPCYLFALVSPHNVQPGMKVRFR